MNKKIIKMNRILTLLWVSSIGIGCGSAPGGGSSSEPFAGTFKGTESISGVGVSATNDITLSLTQTGSVVAGTFSTSTPPSDPISGSVIGSNDWRATLTHSNDASGCNGSLSGLLTLQTDGITLKGVIEGTLGNCGFLSVTVSVIKQ